MSCVIWFLLDAYKLVSRARSTVGAFRKSTAIAEMSEVARRPARGRGKWGGFAFWCPRARWPVDMLAILK